MHTRTRIHCSRLPIEAVSYIIYTQCYRRCSIQALPEAIVTPGLPITSRALY
jgi:hypothetical protein